MSDLLKQLAKERKIEDFLPEITEALQQEILKNIKYQNKLGKRGIIYRIPPFLIGFPLYDVIEVCYIVSKKLKKLGLRTTSNGDKLCVSW